MPIKPVLRMGDPVLLQRAAPVEQFDTPELHALIRDMEDTMEAMNGAGIAAPQIGVSLRVFTYDVDDVIGHLVNPVIGVKSEEEQDGDEGCLSIPGLAFPTVRSLRVVAKGQNMYGDPITVSGSHLLARCVQHETDHLDGILFIDRLDDETRRAALRAIRESAWADEPAPEIRISPHATAGRAL